MSAPTVTAREVADVVEPFVDEFMQPNPPAAVAVVARPEWDGPDTLGIGGLDFSVVPAQSVLAVRAALAEANAPIVLLTPCDKTELGIDVCARLAGLRPRNADRRDALKRSFGATLLDPRLARERWLIDELMTASPVGGFPKAPSGVLTLEHAASTLANHYLGLRDLAPPEAALLEWTDASATRQRLGQAPAELVTTIFDEWLYGAAQFAPLLLAASRSGDEDLVALGLVCGAVASSEGNQAAAAGARLEPRLGGRRLPPAAAIEWGDAAGEVLSQRIQRGEDIEFTLAAAESILQEIDAVDLAVDNKYLRSSFQARLGRFGAALVAAVRDDSALESASAAAEAVAQHRLAAVEEARSERVKMGLRLARWLHEFDTSDLSGLAGTASAYHETVAWVDRARRALSEPEGVADVALAYRALTEAVNARRSEFNANFAAHLAAWDQTPSPSIALIEDVLNECVVPIANNQPVLLLVLDGMGWDVWHELTDSVTARGWSRVVPEGESERPVLATLPTVTENSRTSLLCGRLVSGDQGDEKKEFARYPALVSVSAKSKPPAVFHKGEITRSEGGGLADGLVEMLSDSRRQVVACVVNAIDDHLLKGDQVPHRWTVDGIRPLEMLLDYASWAGRAVIVTSDHGHILDSDTEARVIAGAKERWRPHTGEVHDDEVVISGQRTLDGDGTVVMPFAEQLRYSSGRRNGYHGGATPQEVLIPLDVLVTGAAPAGWTIEPRRRPTWWTQAKQSPVAVPKPANIPAPRTSDDPQGSLFEPAADEASDWVTELLESDTMARQRSQLGARAADQEMLRSLIGALTAAGYPLTYAEIATAMNYPQARLRGFVAAAARLLNIDGYPVLDDDGATVRLDVELALMQFGIE